MSGRDLVTGPVRAAVRAHRNHDAARAEALSRALESGDFERDPYSAYPAATVFVAPCQCVARKEKQSDGDSEWPEWVWNASACTEDADA